VRGWLNPWTFLQRCWHAWSGLPLPPELQALVDWVGTGRALNLYLRILQSAVIEFKDSESFHRKETS